MALKIYRKFIRYFISINLILAASGNLIACGWFATTESYRIAMFKAEIEGMSVFRPFYYTSNYLNTNTPDPQHYDKWQNCREWQNYLGKNVAINDIFFIQYKVAPDMILLAYRNNTLKSEFEGNTFIETLLKIENKELLEYLVFAKKNEFYQFPNFDPWQEESTEVIDFKNKRRKKLVYEVQQLIDKTNNPFLLDRLVFQYIRLLHDNGSYQEVIESFDKHFATNTPKNIIHAWALQYKAFALDNLGNNIKANFLYALVFHYSHDKKIRVYNCFNNDKGILTRNLEAASNNTEKLAIYALSAFQNPGKAMEQISKIYTLDANSNYLAVLIMREINKLEDWIFTPQLTANSNVYYADYERDIIKINLRNDLLYLGQFKSFLKTILNNKKFQSKDYIRLAIAHLNFIENNTSEGLQYLAQISPKAEQSILIQKNIEELLYLSYTVQNNSKKTEQKIADKIYFLEKIAYLDHNYYKILYSIGRQLSLQYEKAGKIAQAGLLLMKTEHYKEFFLSLTFDDTYYMIGYCRTSYYYYLSYFDNKASYNDIDTLLNLKYKKNKTQFEKMLFDQELGSDYAYLDLRGTLAFRQNNLEEALISFAQLPDNFWQTTYKFSNNLNEDPFTPIIIASERKFDYKFNKKKFVEQLIHLKNEAEKNNGKAAINYLKLGHAFYNCTYWGNSWMMMQYEWSVYPLYNNFFQDYFLYGLRKDITSNKFAAYYQCTYAKKYFKLALDKATDSEIQAEATFMLYCCDLSGYHVNMMLFDEKHYADSTAKKPEFIPTNLKKLYANYYNTKTFEKFRCSLMDDFMFTR